MFAKIKTKSYFSFGLYLLSTLFVAALSLSAVSQGKLDSKIIITIERESCFGSCPVYSAQIYADGTVIYEGKEFVKITGKKQHKIPEEKVKELVNAFEQIKYFSLKDKYESDENGMSMTDLPTTTTSIALDVKQKKVVNYFCAPKELDKLENTIDRVAGLYKYIGPL